jgi:hypothetical protein
MSAPRCNVRECHVIASNASEAKARLSNQVYGRTVVVILYGRHTAETSDCFDVCYNQRSASSVMCIMLGNQLAVYMWACRLQQCARINLTTCCSWLFLLGTVGNLLQQAVSMKEVVAKVAELPWTCMGPDYTSSPQVPTSRRCRFRHGWIQDGFISDPGKIYCFREQLSAFARSLGCITLATKA